MTPISAREDVSALWLETLQRAMGRASHDVKDALNGVSVNLEVIRSRASRADGTAGSVAPFGEAAAQQLERLTTLLEAMLALSRVERTPTDVGVTRRSMGVEMDTRKQTSLKQRSEALTHLRHLKMARSAHAYVRRKSHPPRPD